MISPLVDLKDTLSAGAIFADGDWIESKDQDPDGDVRLVQLADVGSGHYIDKSSRFLTSAKAQELRCTFLRPGDILVARMPEPIGRACIFPGDVKPCVTVVDVCIVRPDVNTVNPRWLMHCLNTPEVNRQVTQLATGTTRSRISRSNLGKVKIPFPSINEQRRIASVLDNVDALRAKRRQAIALLDDLAQSIFLDMFGEPKSNVRGMSVYTLGDIVKVKSGSFLPSTQMNQNGKHPVYGGNGISGFHDQYMFDSPRVIIGRVGVYCGCVHLSPARSWITDNALYVSEMSAEVETDYLYYALMQLNLNQYAGRSAQPLISGGRIYGTKIIVPPKSLQRDFSARVRRVDTLIKELRAHLNLIDALFASLQYRAFRGEL